MDEERSRITEPNAAAPANRMQAIIEAHYAGIETWVSLEPVIDPEDSLALIELTHDYVDHYKIGKLNHKTTDINWRKFGKEAITLCEKFKKQYYVKNDLAEFLRGIEFTNTDTRIFKK